MPARHPGTLCSRFSTGRQSICRRTAQLEMWKKAGKSTTSKTRWRCGYANGYWYSSMGLNSYIKRRIIANRHLLGHQTRNPQRPGPRRQQLQRRACPDCPRSRPRLTHRHLAPIIRADLQTHLRRDLARSPEPRHRSPLQQRHLHPPRDHHGSRIPPLRTQHLRRRALLSLHPLDQRSPLAACAGKQYSETRQSVHCGYVRWRYVV